MTAFTRWLQDEIEDEALEQMLPGLIEFSGQTEAQLRLAVAAPQGSLARRWVLQLVDDMLFEASLALGRQARWSDTMRFQRERARR